VKAAQKVSASPLSFKGWFDREETLIQAECRQQQIECTRSDINTMLVGTASIDLTQLQRHLDQSDADAAPRIVHAWVESAVLHQRERIPKGHISTVFPHIRPPPDRNNVPWSEPIADERLLVCLVCSVCLDLLEAPLRFQVCSWPRQSRTPSPVRR